MRFPFLHKISTLRAAEYVQEKFLTQLCNVRMSERRKQGLVSECFLLYLTCEDYSCRQWAVDPWVTEVGSETVCGISDRCCSRHSF